MNTKNYSTADLRRRVSRILVPTDFSDQASKALEWARSFADAFGAKLVLLHVIDIFSLTETGSVMAGSDLLQEVGLKARSLIREFLRLTGSARPMLQARKG
jgi:nucleotide-binding universal stress UspA family protein